MPPFALYYFIGALFHIQPRNRRQYPSMAENAKAFQGFPGRISGKT
jgi:hypothetical protein